MSHTRQEQMEAFGRFLDILDELRVKCPWDRKQTFSELLTLIVPSNRLISSFTM